MGQFWGRAVVAVLGVSGPPSFAGTLVGSIPAQFNRFWDISGAFEELFVFVRSVHSGSLGYNIGFLNVKCRSYT